MCGPASRVEGVFANSHSHSHLPFKWKTLEFAIPIILGIGALALAGVGWGGLGAQQGWWQGGALGNLGQSSSLIMIAVGGVGILSLITLSAIKNRQKMSDHTPRDRREPNPTLQGEQEASSVEDVRSTIQTNGNTIYGADAWKILGLTVTDNVPPMPSMDWDAHDPYFNRPFKENYALLYIPKKVKGGSAWTSRPLDFQTLVVASNNAYPVFNDCKPMGSGWVLVSKKIIPRSKGLDYDGQEQIAKTHQNYRMPYVDEMMVLNLMVYAFTGGELLEIEGNRALSTRCQRLGKTSRSSPTIKGLGKTFMLEEPCQLIGCTTVNSFCGVNVALQL